MRCAGRPRTSKGTAIATTRTAGIATGLALAVLLVLAFRVPASGQALGAGVRITAASPGELHVPAPAGGAFLAARGLMPGGRSVRATLPVRNVTRGPVDVRLRARGGGHELDRALQVELRAGGRRLASGPLAELRRWSRSLRVERGAERTVRARAWIAAGAVGTTGRRAELDLELDARLAEASKR